MGTIGKALFGLATAALAVGLTALLTMYGDWAIPVVIGSLAIAAIGVLLIGLGGRADGGNGTGISVKNVANAEVTDNIVKGMRRGIRLQNVRVLKLLRNQITGFGHGRKK